MAIRFCCGAECAINATGLGLTTNKHLAAPAGTPAIETTVVRSGTRSWRFAAAATNPSHWVDVPASQTVAYLRGYFRMTDATPSAITAIFFIDTAAGSNASVEVTTGGVLTVGYGSGSRTNGPTLANDTWYGVEAEFDMRTNPNTIRWRVWDSVNGWVSQTDHSTGQAGTSILTTFSFGWGIVAGPTSGLTVYVDDLIWGHGTTLQYYDTANSKGGKVLRQLPNADGAHNFAGNAFGTGASGGLLVQSATNIYTFLDEDDQSAITDFVRQITSWVSPTTQAIQIAFGPDETTETNPRFVAVTSTHHSATTTANEMNLRISDNGSAFTNVWGDWAGAGLDISETTAIYLHKVIESMPSTAGAWTQAGVNAAVIEWGNSNDVNPLPYIDNVSLEVEWTESVAGAEALEGTIAAASTVSTPVLNVNKALEGTTVAAASTVSTPVLSVTLPFAGVTIAAASTVANASLDVVALEALEGTIAATSTVSTPVLNVNKALAGVTVAATATVSTPVLNLAIPFTPPNIAAVTTVSTPVLLKATPLAGVTIAAVATLSTPPLLKSVPMVGVTIGAVSTVSSPPLLKAVPVVGVSIDATSTAAATTLRLQAALAGNVAVTATVAGALDVEGTGGAKALDGTIAAAATLSTPVMGLARPIAGDAIAAVSTVSTPVMGLARPLAGVTIGAVAVAAGDMTVTASGGSDALAGEINAGTTLPPPVLTVNLAFTGTTIGAVATVPNASLTVAKALAGVTIAATTTLSTPVLVVARPLAGTVAATAALTAALDTGAGGAAVAFEGTIAVVTGTSSPAIRVTLSFGGETITAVATVADGALNIARRMTGTVTATAVLPPPVLDVAHSVTIAGSAAAVAALTGALTVMQLGAPTPFPTIAYDDRGASDGAVDAGVTHYGPSLISDPSDRSLYLVPGAGITVESEAGSELDAGGSTLSFTVECWWKPAGVGAPTSLVGKASAWMLSHDAATTFSMSCWLDGLPYAAVGATLCPTVGQTYHVVGSYDAATGFIAVYVDGVLDGSGTQPGALASNGNPVYIGPVSGSAGAMDEVAYFGRALADAEIAAHHTAGTT